MDQWTNYQASQTSFGSWNGTDMTLTPPLFQPITQPPYGSYGQPYNNHAPPSSTRFESPQLVRSFPLHRTRFPVSSTQGPPVRYDSCGIQGSPVPSTVSCYSVHAETSECSSQKPFILFAVNFDNVSVRNLCQEDHNLIYLVAYDHEIDLLSAMSIEDLLKLEDVQIRNPEDGVRILTTVEHMKLTLSENSSDKVYSIEKHCENSTEENSCSKDEEELSDSNHGKGENPLTNETKETVMKQVLIKGEAQTKKSEVKEESETEEVTAKEKDNISVSRRNPRIQQEIIVDSNIEKAFKRENRDVQSVLKKLCGMKQTLEDDKRNSKLTHQCPVCRQSHIRGACVIGNPRTYIPDNTTSANSNVFAYSSLPPQFCLGVSEELRGFSVYAADKIVPGTAFGPVVGQEIDYESVQCLMDLKYVWFLQPRQERPVKTDKDGDEDGEDEVQTFLTTEDEIGSNWCRFLRPTIRFSESCLYYVQTDTEIFFITRRTVKKGEEVKYYAGYMDDQEHLELADELRCHRCGLDFVDAVSYVKHIKIVHPRGITRKKEKCKICHKVFHKYAHLANHAQNEHGGMGAYKCEQCGRDYLYARQLNRHLQTVHKQENPETSTCSICNTTFKNSWRLKHHMRRNHSEKRFECEKCFKIFNSKMGLERHLKTHTQEFAIFCDRCGKGFRDGSNLKVHLLTHSGIKPFACLEADCATAYTTKQCLQIHYRKAHGYAEENMPEIIRTVPFTVEAHSSDTV